MRTVKILLIIVLLAVSVLYGITIVSEKFTGAHVPPTLKCDTDTLEVSVHDDVSTYLTGVTASDQQDGDLTGNIYISGVSKLISAGTAKVTYLVFDSDHNMASLTRFLHYTDYRSPRFSIKEPLVYGQNESIALLDRIQATDVIDGDITDSIRVSMLSAAADAETYTVTLQVTNSMGDTTRIDLPVIQYAGTSDRPTVKLSAYLIYLSQGSSFNAHDYLTAVEIPDGMGKKTDVQITGSVDTETPGTYTVRYTYPYNGTSGSSVLTVVVE